MSLDLDPQWQSEPSDRPVRVTVRESAGPARAAATTPVTTISRRPAALAGVLLVIGAALSVYGGADLFSAQTGTTTVDPKPKKGTIVITDAGFTPASLTVSQGDTVTLDNKASIPHILSSDTLETTEGLLTTPVIFTGSTLTFTVKSDAKVGTHVYLSMTSTLSGSIVVKEKKSSASSAAKNGTGSSVSSAVTSASSQIVAAPIPVSSSSAAAIVTSSNQQQTTASSQVAQLPAVPPVGPGVGAPQVPVIPTTPVGMVPRNPYAQQRVVAPTESQTSSLRPGAPLQPSKPPISQHKPVSQPGSGPAQTGILVAISFAALLFVSRKTLSKGAWTVG